MIWKLFQGNPRTHYKLARDASIKPHELRRIEALSRKVAAWAGSRSASAIINSVRIDPGKQSDRGVYNETIGLCWTADGLFGGPRPRDIWVQSGLSNYEETKTYIHELAHAFCPAKEWHGPLFRKICLVTWSAYFKPSRGQTRREAKRLLRQYQAHWLWIDRKELRELLKATEAAKSCPDLRI